MPAAGPGESMKPLRWIKPLLFVLALGPLARLLVLGFTDGLGANPIEFITRSTGTWTLALLLVTLSITPLRQLTGLNWLIRLRRMLGLYAFFYACLHLTTYIWLDQFFDVSAMLRDVIKRPFITAGALTFILLVPLAVTSTDAMLRRLGGKRWQRLHRLVYVSAVTAVLHFLWLVKKDLSEPLVYAGVLAALLGYRVLRWLWPRLATAGLARTAEH